MFDYSYTNVYLLKVENNITIKKKRNLVTALEKLEKQLEVHRANFLKWHTRQIAIWFQFLALRRLNQTSYTIYHSFGKVILIKKCENIHVKRCIGYEGTNKLEVIRKYNKSKTVKSKSDLKLAYSNFLLILPSIASIVYFGKYIMSLYF